MAFKDDVKTRLNTFGYTVLLTDDSLIDYAISKAESDIKIFTNQSNVPEDCKSIWIDMSCGEFFNMKYLTGGLTGFNCDPAVSSIKEGDTQLNFSGVKQKTEVFISELLNRKMELIKWRKLVW